MKGILEKTLRIVFELNQYEAKVLAVLMTHGRCNVKFLAQSEVPRSRIYDVGVTLVAKGFIKEHGKTSDKGNSEPISWEAHSLKDIESSIKTKLMQEVTTKMNLIKNMKKQIDKEIKEEGEVCTTEAKM